MRQFIISTLIIIMGIGQSKAQDYKFEPLTLELGYHIRPIVYYHPSSFSEEYSLIPNVEFAIGTKDKKMFVALSNSPSIGFRINTKYFYFSGYYMVSIFNRHDSPKHGAGIDFGFNHFFTFGQQSCTFYLGVGLGLLGRFNADFIELNIMPMNIGLSILLIESKGKRM